MSQETRPDTPQVEQWPEKVQVVRSPGGEVYACLSVLPHAGALGCKVADYLPASRTEGLVKALREIDASLILQPDGTFKGYGSLPDTLRVIKAHAVDALAAFKEDTNG